MKITKLGHCCLIIETKGKKILVDPGSYTIEQQTEEKNIDIILITHEHPDHFDLESVVKIVANNFNTVIITNEGVGEILKKRGIKYEVLENKIVKEFLGIEIEALDCRHEEIFEEFGQVKNTAFFIDRRLLCLGDSFYNPEKPVEILALPVAGPWAKVKDAMQYVLATKPKICFPVHDGMLKSFGSAHRVPGLVLPKFNITFKNFEDNKTEEF